MKKLLAFAFVLLLVLSSATALSSPFTVGLGSSLRLGSGTEETFLTGSLDIGTVPGGRTSPVSFILDLKSELGFNPSESTVLFNFSLLSGAGIDFESDFFIDILASFSTSVTIDEGNGGDRVDYAPGVALNIGTNLDDSGFLTVYVGMGAEYRIVRKKPLFTICCGMKMGL